MARSSAAVPLRELEAADMEDIRERLAAFVRPFQEMLVREEQRRHLLVYVEGRMRGLPRRTSEPVAVAHGVKARPLQHFVGQGKWAHEALREGTCIHVGEELGSRRGVLILDGSDFAKSGCASVGVQRQWCGRLGKQDNCQAAQFLAYASRGQAVLLDCRLYLPAQWVVDEEVRRAAGVPPEVGFQTGWQLALDMVRAQGQHVAHRWVVGDDAYGQVCALRDGLHEASEAYVLEVPGNKAKVRLVREGRWTHAGAWADGLPASAWRHYTVREGEKGPLPVRAAKVRVRCERQRGDGGGRPEVLLVVDSLHSDKRWYYLCSDSHARLEEWVRVAQCRHGVEEALQHAKGQVGLDEYEVRGWVGWHHHMTLCLLALWFLAREKAWLEKRGYALPFHRWHACWPADLYPPGTHTPPHATCASRPGATTVPGRATGAQTPSVPLPHVTSPAHP
jgi:SRSO17 transposase